MKSTINSKVRFRWLVSSRTIEIAEDTTKRTHQEFASEARAWTWARTLLQTTPFDKQFRVYIDTVFVSQMEKPFARIILQKWVEDVKA